MKGYIHCIFDNLYRNSESFVWDALVFLGIDKP